MKTDPEFFSEEDRDRIIQMAWEDRTPFEAIFFQFGLNEPALREFMRTVLKNASFKRWRKRVDGRKTKHRQLLSAKLTRFRCSRQREISGNKISKR
jgi:uncharacterized protein (TIGR03643 family)